MIDIVIELMGGEKPAKDIILEALEWKKPLLLPTKVKYRDILKAVELAGNCGAKISNVIFMEEAVN
ncbi:MAG: hypothetical protein ABRQ39_23545 [Candidatus Eremiobacterota bacterium]